MAFLFGVKKTEAPVPKVSDSIQALREACTMVEKRQQFLSEKMDGLLAAAKARLQSKDRKGAAFQLQRKKMLEKELDSSYGKLQNLEVLINSLESVASTTSIVQAMKVGQQALAETIKLNDVDKIEDIMDDINESIQQVDEVSEAMGRPIGAVIDESELDAELAALEAEADADQLQSLHAPVAVPSRKVTDQSLEQLISSAPAVPSSKPMPIAKPSSKEDDELAELEASLA